MFLQWLMNAALLAGTQQTAAFTDNGRFAASKELDLVESKLLQSLNLSTTESESTRDWRRRHVPSLNQICYLILPQNAADRDLLVGRFNEMVKADKGSLSLLRRSLTLHNVTLFLPPDLQEQSQRHENSQKQSPQAATETASTGSPILHVRRLGLSWDGYQSPSCISLELDQVNVTVEFTNLVLTQSNWNELQIAWGRLIEQLAPLVDRGHLPALRFRKLDLTGNLTLSVLSRPLQQELGSWVFTDMHRRTRKLSRQIQVVARRNHPPGCTLAQLKTLMQAQLQETLQGALTNATDHPVNSLLNAGELVLDTTQLLLSRATDYVAGAGKLTRKQMQSALASSLEKILESRPLAAMAPVREKLLPLQKMLHDSFIDVTDYSIDSFLNAGEVFLDTTQSLLTTATEYATGASKMTRKQVQTVLGSNLERVLDTIPVSVAVPVREKLVPAVQENAARVQERVTRIQMQAARVKEKAVGVQQKAFQLQKQVSDLWGVSVAPPFRSRLWMRRKSKPIHDDDPPTPRPPPDTEREMMFADW